MFWVKVVAKFRVNFRLKARAWATDKSRVRVRFQAKA
jgi:hypothetical protein